MKKILLLAIIFQTYFLCASTFTSQGDGGGNWSTYVWNVTGGADGDGIPDSDDDVIIADGDYIYVDVAGAACNTVNINTDGAANALAQLTVNVTRDLTVTGNIDLNSVNGGGSASLVVNGASSSSYGTLTVGGDINFNIDDGAEVPILTISNFGRLYIAGNFNMYSTNSAISTLPPSSYVEYTGAGSQTIIAIQYGKLKSSGSGARVLSTGTIIIKSNSTDCFVPGTNSYTVTGSTIEFSGGGAQTIPAFTYNNLTIGTNGTKTFENGGTIQIQGSFTCQGAANTYTTTNNTIKFTGSAAQTINFNSRAIATFNDLTFANSGAGVSLTASDAITAAKVLGNITVESGTFDNNGNAITGNSGKTFQVNSGATFKLTGMSAFPTAFSTFTLASGSTIEYGGTTQTVDATNSYHHLTISGSGTKTASAALDVNGVLTITAGTLDMASNQLNCAGNFVNNGTAFTAGTGTIVFDGTTTVSGSQATTFNDVTISGTLTGHATGMNIAGNFTNNGTYTHNSGTVTFNGTTTVSGSATTTFNNITISSTLTSASGTMNVAGNFVNNNTFTHNSGTVAFTGSSTISGSSTTTFNNISITGTLIGVSSGTFNVVGNFTNAGTFTHNSGTVVFNGTTTVSGASTTTFKHVTISGTLIGHATNMNVAGDWTQNGTFTHNSGTVTFNAAGAQAITGTNKSTFYNLAGSTASTAVSCNMDVDLVNALSMSNNATLDFDGSGNNKVFTFVSSSNTATARISDLTGWTGSFSGDATFQRFSLGSGSGTDYKGWVNIGVPCTGKTFSDLDDDLVLACPTCPDGAAGSFYSMYSFSTAANDYNPEPIGTSTTNGQGYLVWIQENGNNAGDVILDVTGTAVIGTGTAPKYTLSSAGSGYNLVANPYQSPVSWNAIRSGIASLDNTLYVYNSDQNGGGDYVQFDGTTSTPAVGSNGIGDDIPAWQGFWVTYTGGGADLVFNEDDKTTTNNAFIKTGAPKKGAQATAASLPTIRLDIAGQGYKTETVFVLKNGATADKDAFDSKKRFSYDYNPNLLAVYSIATNDSIAINYLPDANLENTVVPIHLRAGVTGTYNVTVSEFSNIPGGLCMKLIDHATDIVYDLDASTSFSITANDMLDNARFSLYIPGTFTSSSNSNPPVCNNDNAAMVAQSTGVAPFTYVWKDINNNVVRTETRNTSDTLTAAAGDYTVEITDAGYTCSNHTATELFSFTNPPVIAATTAFSNPFCYNTTQGELIATPNKTGPYNYFWMDSNGDTVQTTLNSMTTADTLKAQGIGNYTVDIVFLDGCGTVTKNYSLTAPAAPAAITSYSNALCYGNSDGKLLATPNDGAPWTYYWTDANGDTIQTSTSSTADSIMNASAGTYTVDIVFANGCGMISKNYTITEPLTLAVNANEQDVTCNGVSDGAITTAVSGGTANYSYVWSDMSTGASIANIAAGTYSVTVTDANNCTISETYTITESSPITFASVTQDVLCKGENTGSITPNVSGGSGSVYTYSWSDNSSASTLTNVIAGSYSVIVSDANNCTSTDTYTINEPSAVLAANGTPVDALCNGGPNGSVSLTVNGGTSGYTYSWSNNTTDANATGLLAGTYTITITDANGCTLTQSYMISEPTTGLTLFNNQQDVSCYGDNDGAVTVIATGGTGPYAYSWSNGNSTLVVNNLIAGTYSVTVTDANNCSSDTVYTITQPVATVAVFSNPDTLYFSSGTTANFSNSSTGATSYAWSFGDGGISSLTSPSHTYADSGSYNVMLIASNNACNASDTLTSVVIVINDVVGINNNKPLNGTITIHTVNNMLMIDFSFTEQTPVMVETYNMLGEKVAADISDVVTQQSVRTELSNNAASQILLVRISTPSKVFTQKVFNK